MRVPARATGTWLTAVAVTGTAVVLAAFAVLLVRQRAPEVFYGLYLLHNGPSAVVLLWMARLVLRRLPGNTAGRVLLAVGVVHGVHVAAALTADLALVRAGFTAPLTRADELGVVPADLPLAASVPLWVMGWLWVPAAVLAIVVLPLVFPDGMPPGRRWRAVPAAVAAGAALLVVAFGIDGWPSADWTPERTPAAVGRLIAAGGLLVLGAAVAALAALVLRWRRADAVRRRQFRVVGIAFGVFAAVGVLSYPWQRVWVPAVFVAINLLIVAYALAVARYRLHEVEPVLGRTAVAAALSVLVGVVYLIVVVGAGSALGGGTGASLPALVAVAAVALLVEPVRRRTRRLVDRVLYGRNADRTEVLSRLAARASSSVTADDVLGEVSELLVRSTGAARAEVWLDDGPAPAAAAGRSDEPAPILRAAVRHQDERFGDLRLYARAAADLVPDAPHLLDDVAHALGVVLRNDRLAGELRARLDELQISRQRLVEAHEQARRGLERDIHDSAQARLIAVRLRLGALRARAGAAADRALAGELDVLAGEVDAAVRALRDVARGLYPPVLEQSGLPDALRSGTRRLPVPVRVTGQGVGRYPRAVESAAYYCCLEAVQNAVRHGGATEIAVDLAGDGTGVRFCVRDDGTGFDPQRTPAGAGLANIGDRVAALGGRAEIDSAPGAGTRISGHIPAEPITVDGAAVAPPSSSAVPPGPDTATADRAQVPTVDR